MKYVELTIAAALCLASAPAATEEAQSFPSAAFNLRKFPPDQRDRFVSSVTRGKNQMPPWGDFFKPDQLEALWAYIMAGER